MEVIVTDFDRELPTKRVYDLGNNKIYLTREDPFGFWSFNFDKGQLPERLKGVYTSPAVAETALNTYLNDKKREVVSKTI